MEYFLGLKNKHVILFVINSYKVENPESSKSEGAQ